jgi:hypothetical protein
MINNPFASSGVLALSEGEESVAYRSNARLVRLLSPLLLTLAVAYLLEGICTAASWVLPEGMRPAENGTPGGAGLLVESVFYVAVVVRLAVTAPLMLWVYRVNQNARALGAQGLRFTPAWSVAWCFIPLGNLVKPYQMFSEIWRASALEATPTSWQADRPPRLLPIWWSTIVIATIVRAMSVSLAAWSSGDAAQAGSMILALVAAPLEVAAAWLCRVIVLSMHRRQGEKAARLAAA